MNWNEFINTELIKRLSHHSSGTIAAIIFFAITGWVLRYLVHEGPVRTIIIYIEDCTLIGLFLWLAIQLFRDLWKGKTDGKGKPDGTTLSFVAA